MKRVQEKYILEDLREKYVFLAGPRQSGKTTLSKQLYHPSLYQYLNYDRPEDRQIMIQGHWSRERGLVILDEFHKFPKWKSFLKGIYDTEGNRPNILMTGSAKLNIFRRGNDSMVGRYYYHRLLPLAVGELKQDLKPEEAVKHLLSYGNFPEPFLKSSLRHRKRWQQQYLERVTREDITDLSNVRQIPKIQLLVDMLRQRVGSNISYASLARDLEIAPKTAKEWIDLLEQLYIVFRVTPYYHNIARSLLKEPKIYFFDCTMAFNQESHLENLVAVSLLKHLWFMEDNEGITGRLHYLRTKDGKEIDFVTVQDSQIMDLIEVKTGEDQLHSAFYYFSKWIKPKGSYQLVLNLRQPKTVEGISIQSVAEYLSQLN